MYLNRQNKDAFVEGFRGEVRCVYVHVRAPTYSYLEFVIHFWGRTLESVYVTHLESVYVTHLFMYDNVPFIGFAL